MRLVAPLLILGAGLAVLMLTPAEARIFGLDHQAFATSAGMAALLAYILGRTRAADLARILSSATIWAALLIGLTAAYAYRFEAGDFIGRVASELLPSEPQVGQGGEVIINRRLSGEFAVAARVNGARVTFLFDTGASVVVLTAADARRAGLNTAGLSFDVPVTTANGSALAAAVRLDQIAVGPIVMHNVRALVARPGALDESLLGMSFLERLKSYTVERGRLVLEAAR
jgi:aspartyl protease family protein